MASSASAAAPQPPPPAPAGAAPRRGAGSAGPRGGPFGILLEILDLIMGFYVDFAIHFTWILMFFFKQLPWILMDFTWVLYGFRWLQWHLNACCSAEH